MNKNFKSNFVGSLQWGYNGCDGVSNPQCLDCLLNRLFWHRSKKTSKLRVTGLCDGNSRVTGEFPSQRASNAETVSIRWRHHDIDVLEMQWQHLLNLVIAGLENGLWLIRREKVI